MNQNKKTNVYITELSGDDMGLAPERWTRKGIEAYHAGFFWWGYIMTEDALPILVMRCFTNPDNFENKEESCGTLFHIKPAKGMFQNPEILDNNQLSGTATLLPYRKISTAQTETGFKEDEIYETRAVDNGEEMIFYRAEPKRCQIKEKDILDVHGENMPYAICIDPPGVFAPYFQWHTLFKGTYYGNACTMLGGADRWYSAVMLRDLDDRDAYYFANIIFGINEDGTHEYGSLYHVNGKTFAWYVKDGQTPKCSESVQIDAEWVCDPTNPELLSPKKLVWRFDEIEVHWEAEFSILYGMGTNTNHGGSWYEKNGSRAFRYSLGVVECNIKPDHVKKFNVYKP